MKNCCVLGLGYIGLPTAALLAGSGFRVLGVDVKNEVVETINKGEIHINEPNLSELVKKAIENKSLMASLKPLQADVFLIAVPTPFKKDDSGEILSPNLEYVYEAAKSIARVLKPRNLVIIESTSPVGTTDKVFNILKDFSGLSDEEINLAYCPERVIPGNIIEELINNDRVVGGKTDSSSKLANVFYKSFCKGDIFITNSATAELVKLTENSFRDLNIAFANEISMICERLNINHKELISLANKHPRVNILEPGCGVGGHCIAVDPWFLISALPDNTELIRKSRETNLRKTKWVIDKIEKECAILEKELGREIVIGCMGITFKPNIDDLRESPALEIVKALINKKKDVIICEPNLNISEFSLLPLNKVIKKADLLVFLVSHKEFKEINSEHHRNIDFCGALKL